MNQIRAKNAKNLKNKNYPKELRWAAFLIPWGIIFFIIFGFFMVNFFLFEPSPTIMSIIKFAIGIATVMTAVPGLLFFYGGSNFYDYRKHFQKTGEDLLNYSHQKIKS